MHVDAAAENEPPSTSAGNGQDPSTSAAATAGGSGNQESLAAERAAEASGGRATRASAATPVETGKRKADLQPSIERFFAKKPAK